MRLIPFLTFLLLALADDTLARTRRAKRGSCKPQKALIAPNTNKAASGGSSAKIGGGGLSSGGGSKGSGSALPNVGNSGIGGSTNTGGGGGALGGGALGGGGGGALGGGGGAAGGTGASTGGGGTGGIGSGGNGGGGGGGASGGGSSGGSGSGSGAGGKSGAAGIWSNSTSSAPSSASSTGAAGQASGSSNPGQASSNGGTSGAGSPTTGGSSGNTTATGIGAVMSSSFTQYGAGDSFGSPNCNTATAACGWYSNPGYNAAVSQNLYGVGPGGGAGETCGKCYQLTAVSDQAGAPLSGGGSIIVKVNNLCPAAGNPLCSQDGLSGTNQYGANVNFDICKDDGAAKEFFGSSTGMALGHAVEVDCGSWSGSENLTS